MDPPHQISQDLQWSGRSDCGKVRPNNEDAFLGLRFDASEIHHLGVIGEGPTGHMDFVFAVSDGMGGAKSGEQASRIAVQKIMTLLPRSYLQSAIGLEAGFPDLEPVLVHARENVFRPHWRQPHLLSARANGRAQATQPG
jgi:protein phosphatase